MAKSNGDRVKAHGVDLIKMIGGISISLGILANLDKVGCSPVWQTRVKAAVQQKENTSEHQGIRQKIQDEKDLIQMRMEEQRSSIEGKLQKIDENTRRQAEKTNSRLFRILEAVKN